MNPTDHLHLEILRKQESIRNDYQNAQKGFGGVRRLVGNTLIALGDRIHGTPIAPHEVLNVGQQFVAPHDATTIGQRTENLRDAA